MPIINILFWTTLVLASIVLWKIYAYMAAAEEEAERQYEQLLMEEHMCDMLTRRSDGSLVRNNNYTYAANRRPALVQHTDGRLRTDRSKQSTKYRQPRHRRSHRTVA